MIPAILSTILLVGALLAALEGQDYLLLRRRGRS